MRRPRQGRSRRTTAPAACRARPGQRAELGLAEIGRRDDDRGAVLVQREGIEREIVQASGGRPQRVRLRYRNPGFVDSPTSDGGETNEGSAGALSRRSSRATAGCSASSDFILSRAERASVIRWPSSAAIARWRATSNCGWALFFCFAFSRISIALWLPGRTWRTCSAEAIAASKSRALKLSAARTSRRSLSTDATRSWRVGVSATRLLEGDQVHVGRRVRGLLQQLAGRREARIHLQDEVAADEAIVDLALFEEVQGVAERRQDLVPHLPRQGGVAGVRRIGHAAHGPILDGRGRRSLVWITVAQL